MDARDAIDKEIGQATRPGRLQSPVSSCMLVDVGERKESTMRALFGVVVLQLRRGAIFLIGKVDGRSKHAPLEPRELLGPLWKYL
jgi:hypothetical protein